MAFFVTAEGEGEIGLVNAPDPLGLAGPVVLEGQFPQLGEFKLEITEGPETNRCPQKVNQAAWAEQPLDRSVYASLKVPPKNIWQTKGTTTECAVGIFD